MQEQVTKATETVTAQTVNGTEQAVAQATETTQKVASTARAARNATKA